MPAYDVIGQTEISDKINDSFFRQNILLTEFKLTNDILLSEMNFIDSLNNFLQGAWWIGFSSTKTCA